MNHSNNSNTGPSTLNTGKGSNVIIEGQVTSIDPVAGNMATENIDGITVADKVKPNTDPNVVGSQSEQNVYRDITSAVQDPTAVGIRIPGQAYGKPPISVLLLQDYFRKPVLIGTFDWTTSTSTTTMNPYGLWEALSVVNSRFSYFNKRSYNLIVSFSLAGSPYHYGASVVDWNPSNRGATTSLSNPIGYQRRHQVLTPDISYYELAIPHFAENPYNVGSAAVATSKGTLSFSPQFALARVDGVAAGTIKVVVRAWTDDMVITEPSYCQTMAQSKIGGIVEGFAKGIYETAAPILGVADGIAALFGFCVNNDNNSTSMSVKSIVAASNVDGMRPVEVLTTSQQNRIVPYDVGSNLTDELTIASLTSRRALIRRISSYTTTSAINDVLLNIPITPMLGIAANGFSPTPLAYVSNLFNYWTGSLAFTITVYSSPLQQGAILISHEPSTTLPTSANNTQAVATAKSCILDLATSKKKTIWVSAAGGVNEILPTRNITSSLTSVTPDYIDSTVVDPGVYGGWLSISVNKPLIAPAASSVYITVEVSAGPDFQLLDFSGETINAYTYTMLSVRSPNFSVKDDVCDLRIKVFDDVRAKHSGETVVSLRALAQRMGLVQEGVVTVKSSAFAGPPVLYTTLNVNRLINIHNFKGENSFPSTQTYEQEYNDIFIFISAMFARRSGGSRYYVRVTYRSTTSSPQIASIYRMIGTFDVIGASNSLYSGTTNALNVSGNVTLGGTGFPSNVQTALSNIRINNGFAQTDLRTNPYLSVEDTPVSTSVYMDDDTHIELRLEMRDVYALDTYFTVYRCTKEDTQFYEFVGTPVSTKRSLGTFNQSNIATSDGTIV